MHKPVQINERGVFLQNNTILFQKRKDHLQAAVSTVMIEWVAIDPISRPRFRTDFRQGLPVVLGQRGAGRLESHGTGGMGHAGQ
jgi:hypothetical protein